MQQGTRLTHGKMQEEVGSRAVLSHAEGPHVL